MVSEEAASHFAGRAVGLFPGTKAKAIKKAGSKLNRMNCLKKLKGF